MRGALKEKSTGGQRTRIIPADAGSTDRFGHQYNVNKDHPRGCGEHCNTIFKHIFYLGSSPRMRGAQIPYFLYSVLVRIIPADAGSTGKFGTVPRKSWDHPRGCGEHHLLQCPGMMGVGSSPRMRGAHQINSLWPNLDGIIPADAGSTGSNSKQARVSKDHPRGCGEHRMKTSLLL